MLWGLTLGSIGLALVDPALLGVAALLIVLAYCAMSLVLKVFLIVGALRSKSDSEGLLLDPHECPRITLLVPLRNEAKTLAALLKALADLDYPKDCLEVLFLVEADDAVTKASLSDLPMPSFAQILSIPVSEPRTKPKAMNVALPFATGSIIGIYDAEDQPERDQLAKAVTALFGASEDVACVQARLNHYNSGEGFLERFAAMEYALWFDILLKGLAHFKLPVPLGGTSLFIKTDVLREIGAWDPYNVTEDADLGVRLARDGWRAEMIDSTTWEEALDSKRAWIKQRSRWIKGFMVTWMVHMREPRDLMRALGTPGALAINIMLFDGFVAFLIQPLFWIAIAGWLLGWGGAFSAILGGWLGMAAAIVFLGSHAVIVVAAFIAARRRFGLRRALLSPFLWVYWQLGAFAAYRAAWEMATNRFGWAKTAHGDSDAARLRRDAALVDE